MNDIVDRLRSTERDLNNGFPMTCERGRTMQEAADEIERLRDALEAAEDGMTVAYIAGHDAGKDLSAAKIGLLTAALEFGLDLVGQDDLEGKAGWDAFVISANEARASLSQKGGE